MQIRYTTARSDSDLLQILDIQSRNLKTATTPDEQSSDGFVTVVHSFDLLKSMNDACAHTIAKDGDQVVGYALSMTPAFSSELPVLRPMFEQINRRLAVDVNYLVMGQICIEKSYRRRGIFRGMYESMREQLSSLYDCLVTEIDVDNQRSMSAHLALGFASLHQYTSAECTWTILVWDW